jgi:hypothetical protein
VIMFIYSQVSQIHVKHESISGTTRASLDQSIALYIVPCMPGVYSRPSPSPLSIRHNGWAKQRPIERTANSPLNTSGSVILWAIPPARRPLRPGFEWLSTCIRAMRENMALRRPPLLTG